MTGHLDMSRLDGVPSYCMGSAILLPAAFSVGSERARCSRTGIVWDVLDKCLNSYHIEYVDAL